MSALGAVAAATAVAVAAAGLWVWPTMLLLGVLADPLGTPPLGFVHTLAVLVVVRLALPTGQERR